MKLKKFAPVSFLAILTGVIYFSFGQRSSSQPAVPGNPADIKPEVVNFFMLGADAEKWNGAYIEIEGYLYTDGKNSFLCADPSDKTYFQSRKIFVVPLELEYEKSIFKSAEKINGEIAAVRCYGYYDAFKRGSNFVYFGELKVNKVHVYGPALVPNK